MIDYDILKSVGTTQERLRELFTSQPFSDPANRTPEEMENNRLDCEMRKTIELRIQGRLMEHIQFSLNNYYLYSAIDVAWDSVPINKATYPLLLYAQGKLDMGKCATELARLNCADGLVTKDPKGVVTGIDLPKFAEVNINLIRSFVTRRLAAQSNKYSNLFPFYKYESRSTSLVGKLRSDLISQRMEIMTDQYDYRHNDVQVERDMLLYGHCLDFMRSSWERDIHWIKEDPTATPNENGELAKRDVITKEGVAWVHPHPTRVFWDNAYPMSSLNTDTGCEYCGFWDVIRFRDLKGNPMYWNRDRLAFSSHLTNLFSNYAQYFSQYYCTINVPTPQTTGSDKSGPNDRQNNVGLYSADQEAIPLIIANTYLKIVPKEYRMGDYPYPVWIRLVTAGDNIVLFAEILPTSPAAVASYNENDSRQVNISFAHELLPYQDQLTNLFSYLLQILKTDTVKIVVMDTDLITSDESRKSIERQVKGQNYYSDPILIELSGSKMRELGLDVSKVVTLIETRQSQAINIIFQAIVQLLSMVERLTALSPQEQGQPAPREISATETNLIAGTTETVYGFISDAIDEYRAAKKRMLYEAYMAKGSQDIRLPVLDRYTDKVIQLAGFEVMEQDRELFQEPDAPYVHTVTGTKNKLLHDYIFTTRDGAERSVNTQSANVLTQLLATLQNPVILNAIGKERLYDVVNEIFRLSGAGYDLKLEMKEGESDAIGVDPNQQVQGILSQLTQHVEQLSQRMDQIQQDMMKAQGKLAA